MSSVVVLVETEVPAAEGTEDDVAPSAVDGAMLLSLAAAIHVGTDGWDDDVGGGGDGSAVVASRPP